ncbi:MAG: LytTR family DNA-binding domain-containing protein [Solobacterium sp.]|jgi:DNA-binding LytR/AlgR family response regulator|nr:LytTR family DNA-binding domain-containing protein [Solobacterium sp.]MCH4221908.1 LytTR family DNA-binding domain-containing protein [Solobacterium sp.]MCH4265222.1 LytTR family DNA-binding domain-containing protein [Solobacterium sp.]
MEIKVAVVDDNDTDRVRITKSITDLGDLNTDVTLFSSSEELLASREQFTVYFLDIDMPGMNGLQLCERICLKNPNAMIVFCSNFEHYVFDAFKTSAVYFVRKANFSTDFAVAINKIQSRLKKNEESFTIQVNGSFQSIKYCNVIYYEVNKNDMFIHTSKAVYRIRKTMKALTGEMNRSDFYQIHASYMINLNHLSEIRAKAVRMDSDDILPISSAHSTNIKHAYQMFLISGDQS